MKVHPSKSNSCTNCVSRKKPECKSWIAFQPFIGHCEQVQSKMGMEKHVFGVILATNISQITSTLQMHHFITYDHLLWPFSMLGWRPKSLGADDQRDLFLGINQGINAILNWFMKTIATGLYSSTKQYSTQHYKIWTLGVGGGGDGMGDRIQVQGCQS